MENHQHYRYPTSFVKAIFWVVWPVFISWGQTDSLRFEWGGLVDTYYAYALREPQQEQKLPFQYSYNRHNEWAINLALVRGKVSYQNTYAVVALQAGTYVEDNYAQESIQLLNEAYVGIVLDRAQKHRLEVGIMPSYIGFESATTFHNYTLTRSLLADNSPYFMTGLAYRYQPNTRWMLGAWLTNGWQRIRKPDRTSAPGVGTQLTFKPKAHHTLNWSTYAGKEAVGLYTGMRWFHNLYWEAQWSAQWQTIVGWDLGWQKAPEGYRHWSAPIVMVRYTPNTHWQMAARVEYYTDPEQALIQEALPLTTWGVSGNVDYRVNAYCKLRSEVRHLSATQPLLNGQSTQWLWTTGLAFMF